MITSFFSSKKKTPNSGPGKRRPLDDANNSQPITEPSKKARVSTESNPEADDAVAALLESLDAASPGDATSWRSALQSHFQSARFRSLAWYVAQERARATIYPPPADTWSALNLTPLADVRVVVVGQDPYHGPGQAHGLCFSVLGHQPPPPSLKNMYKELVNDGQVPEFATAPKHGNLTAWAKQGVLMINTCMTVRRGEANSHKKRGWEEVTDAIIRAVDRRSRKLSSKGVVFLLWGKPAATKAEALLSSSNSSRHHEIIRTSHPSPLGATKTNAPFLGSRCFSRCNEALVKMGHEPIDWRLE